MVNTLALALVGVLAYTLLALALRARGLLPESVRVQGPITTLHTKRGRAFLEWLAGPRRFWRAWGNFGVGITLVILVGSFLAVAVAGWSALTRPETTAISKPQNVLVIPGVNEFLPLTAAPAIVFGLLVGLVVHEGGHGLLCRVEDIDIDSMGLALFTLIPIGAFVEPDDESRKRADRGAQSRMFAAGVTNNFAITILAFALLFGPLAGSIVAVSGVPVGGVLPGSAAAQAGIEQGDVITAVDGREVTGEDDFDALLANESDREVRVRLEGGETVTVQRSLVVTRAVADGPIGINTSVSAVNGSAVHTRPALLSALADREVARLSTAEGNVTIPAGAYAGQVVETPNNSTGQGLAAAGAPKRPHVITRIGGERVRTADEMRRVLAETDPGQTVSVVAYVDDDETPWDGQRRTYEVTLDGRGGQGLLGVGAVRQGVSGFDVQDFGIDAYPAEQFLLFLGGGEGPPLALFFRRFAAVLVLPFASAVDPAINYNFAGFTGVARNFYAVDGPLSFLGGGVFVLANLAFWTGWVNLNLGFFNCIPAYPLDGGHILRTGTEAVVARLPVSDRRWLTSAVTTVISVAMLAGVILMVFGPQLLGG